MTLDEVITVLKIRQHKAKVYTDEAKLIKDVKESLEMLDDCCVIRQEAVHKIGIPDLTLCYNGRFIAIELKDDEGSPSTLQVEWLTKIAKAGGIAIVANSVYPVIEALKRAAL